MSKHAKALAKLCAKPPSADIKWDELKSLLEHLGYVLMTGSGSRCKFYCKEKNALIICHRPHPSPSVDKGCIADIAEHLRTYGFIKDKEQHMDILKYKGYEGSAEIDMDRQICRGKILFIDDVVTFEAASPAELKKEFEIAVDDYIETCATLKREPQMPLRGQFNVRIPPTLHKAAARRALTDNISLNDVVVRALDAFLNAQQIPGSMEKSRETVVSSVFAQTQWTAHNVTTH